MTDDELLKMLKITNGDDEDDTVLLTYLTIAKSEVLKRLYPFDRTKREIPHDYCMNVINIATFLIGKRGAEGETEHTEGDVKRVYANANIPDEMLSDITPFVG
jgi:hypothetical protein